MWLGPAVDQGLTDVLTIKIGIGKQDLVEPAPEETSPTTVPTVTLVPSMQGFPPVMLGFVVMRSSVNRSIRHFLVRVYPSPVLHQV